MGKVWKLGLVLLLSVRVSLPWGAEGHRVIARIAAKHLSPQAQARVAALLATDSQAGPILSSGSGGDALAAAMAEIGPWADTIKGTKLGAGTDDWHFLDLAAADGAAEISRRCVNNDCVTAQLSIMTANLKAGSSLPNGSNTYSPAQQLKFIVHFIGDLHQPLHCATNADAGGNCLATRGFSEHELHATWDTGLIEQIMKDSKGHEISEATFAATLDSEFAAQFAGSTNIADFGQMALESHDIAFQVAYGPMLARGILPGVEPRSYLNVDVSRCASEAPDFYNINPPLDLTVLYNAATLDAVRWQLAKAGYRLAVVLNNALQ
jgi:hypothetical protein